MGKIRPSDVLETVLIAESAATIRAQRHIVDVPMLCPRTYNPRADSTVEIKYRPEGNRVLEVYSLSAYVCAFYGDRIVRDIEQFALVVAEDCGRALQCPVEVTVSFVLYIGQRVTTWTEYTPA